MKIFSSTTLVLFVLLSCSTNEKKEDTSTDKPSTEQEKTPTDYGNDYCECMNESSSDFNSCLHILTEAQDKFGIDNEEAEKEFTAVMQNCMD